MFVPLILIPKMTGKRLKEILADEGINLAKLSRSLGFDNDQRLHSALRAEDVKSGLIEQIAKATNKSVCFFYKTAGDSTARDNGIAVLGDGNSVTTLSERFISLLEKKVCGQGELPPGACQGCRDGRRCRERACV